MKEFIDHLRQEKLETQKHRVEFIKLKFLLVVGLFGVGNWNFAEFSNNYLLLYLIPFVGFAIDLYIHGENFAVRRIGYFLRENVRYVPVERTWEYFVSNNRDKYTRTGIYAVSILIFLGVFLILEVKPDNEFRINYLFWHYLWVLINLILLVTFIVFSHRGYKSLNKNKTPIFFKMTKKYGN